MAKTEGCGVRRVVLRVGVGLVSLTRSGVALERAGGLWTDSTLPASYFGCILHTPYVRSSWLPRSQLQAASEEKPQGLPSRPVAMCQKAGGEHHLRLWGGGEGSLACSLA